jgi:hypothetical protein
MYSTTIAAMAVVVKETIADLQKSMPNKKETENKHYNKDEHPGFGVCRSVRLQNPIIQYFYTHTHSV